MEKEMERGEALSQSSLVVWLILPSSSTGWYSATRFPLTTLCVWTTVAVAMRRSERVFLLPFFCFFCRSPRLFSHHHRSVRWVFVKTGGERRGGRETERWSITRHDLLGRMFLCLMVNYFVSFVYTSQLLQRFKAFNTAFHLSLHSWQTHNYAAWFIFLSYIIKVPYYTLTDSTKYMQKKNGT
jgi:hypothetical protein